MSNYVLDASAILAVMLEEKGSDAVVPLLGRAVVSSVNLCEAVTKLAHAGVPAAKAQLAIEDMVETVVDFTPSIALIAATIARDTQPLGLSLGDRACLATALHLKREALTADKAWKKLPFPMLCIR